MVFTTFYHLSFGTGMQTALFVFPAIINEYKNNSVYYEEINHNIYYSYSMSPRF